MEKQAATAKAEKTIKCQLCQLPVPIAEYTTHVQKEHSVKNVSPTMTTQTAAEDWFPAGATQAQRMSGPIKTSDYEDNYLKGSDVPLDSNTVSFKVLGFLNITGSRSKLTAQISETFGKKMWGLNTMNIRAIGSLGYADLQQTVGKTYNCAIVYQPNPQKANEPTRSLFVTSIQ